MMMLGGWVLNNLLKIAWKNAKRLIEGRRTEMFLKEKKIFKAFIDLTIKPIIIYKIFNTFCHCVQEKMSISLKRKFP